MNQISPLAYVHPEAKLGDNNIIGPFCYIDRNVEIGDNNVMQNSVTIHVGARIGNGNEFFPGASISTKPQDLKFRGEETICRVGDNNSIRENVTISRGTASRGETVVGSNNLLMECVHVAHDCILGSGLIIGNSTKLAGEVIVDDNAIISANVLCHQFGSSEKRFFHCRHHRSAHAGQCGTVACRFASEIERCLSDKLLAVVLPRRSDAVGRFGENDRLPCGGADLYSCVCDFRDEDQPKN